jgi:Got1/Sft2-like family
VRSETTVQVSALGILFVDNGQRYQGLCSRIVFCLAFTHTSCSPLGSFSRNMFDEKRRQTSIIYLSCLVATLVVIFLPLPSAIKLILLLLLMLTQFCASVWYTLSYIPYGRRTVSRFLKRQLGLEESPDYSNIALPSLRLGSGGGAS